MRHRLEGLLSNAHRYVPLHVSGAKAEHVVAFARLTEGEPAAARQAVIVVVPRLVARLVGWNPDVPAARSLPCGAEIWADTRIELPSDVSGPLQNVLTGVSYDLPASNSLAELLADFPIAVLGAGKARLSRREPVDPLRRQSRRCPDDRATSASRNNRASGG